MAQVTARSTIATPGRVQAPFAAKRFPRDDTRFTELQVHALPGKIHVFIEKGDFFPRGDDRFTELQVYGTPGKIHVFTPKIPVPPVVPPVVRVVAHGGGPQITALPRKPKRKIRRLFPVDIRDDEEAIALAIFLFDE